MTAAKYANPMGRFGHHSLRMSKAGGITKATLSFLLDLKIVKSVSLKHPHYAL